MRRGLGRLRRNTTGALDCHEVGVTLQRYLDGDIDADSAGRIEAHLELCLRCGMELALYRRIKDTLAAQRPQLPAESVQRLHDFGVRLAQGQHPIQP